MICRSEKISMRAVRIDPTGQRIKDARSKGTGRLPFEVEREIPIVACSIQVELEFDFFCSAGWAAQHDKVRRGV